MSNEIAQNNPQTPTEKEPDILDYFEESLSKVKSDILKEFTSILDARDKAKFEANLKETSPQKFNAFIHGKETMDELIRKRTKAVLDNKK